MKMGESGGRYFSSAGCFTFCLCLAYLSHAFNLGSLFSIITTIESRFQFQSYQVGVIVGMYQTGILVVSLFVTYFGGKSSSHKPRCVFVGLIIAAIGSFITALPHFIVDDYDYRVRKDSNISSCIINSSITDDDCTVVERDAEKDNELAYGLAIFGQFVIGVGWTFVATLGLVYIDDNVSASRSGFYAGIANSMYGVGTIVAFVVGGFFLLIWVDFDSVNISTITIDDTDARWVGAWWIGLLIGVVLFVGSSFPFLCFPKHLPHLDDNKRNENHNGVTADQVVTSSPHENPNYSMYKAIRIVCTTPSFICVSMANVTISAITAAIGSFTPKYLETQYGLTASDASILTGVIPLPAYGIGMAIGGYLLKRLQLRAQGIAVLTLIFSIVAALLTLVVMFLGCNQPQLIGVTHDLDLNDLNDISLTFDCNANCSCTENQYKPVCVDELTYFSPCHAGCLDEYSSNKTYGNCGCVPFNGQIATDGTCDSDCKTLIPFLCLFFVLVMSVSAQEMPQLMLTFRSVPREHKSLALGIRYIVIGAFGIIPAPIAYGALIDRTCLSWNEVCETRGACWVYDIVSYRYTYIGFTLAILVLDVIFCLLCFLAIRKYGAVGEVDEPTETELTSADNAAYLHDR